MASYSTIDSRKFIMTNKRLVYYLFCVAHLQFNHICVSILSFKSKVWIKPVDRSKFMANMMASALGAAITMPICGFIIEKINWQSTFYFTGKIINDRFSSLSTNWEFFPVR